MAPTVVEERLDGHDHAATEEMRGKTAREGIDEPVLSDFAHGGGITPRYLNRKRHALSHANFLIDSADVPAGVIGDTERKFGKRPQRTGHVELNRIHIHPRHPERGVPHR